MRDEIVLLKMDVSKVYRMMQEQIKILFQKADMAGMGESEFIRLLITNEPVNNYEFQNELDRLINEAERVVAIINRIVRNNNS